MMPIRTFQSEVELNDEEIPVSLDTVLLRVALLKQSDAALKQYFNYELAPYPLPLFDEASMRKSPKSVSYDLFPPITDGGFFLHESKKFLSNDHNKRRLLSMLSEALTEGRRYRPSD